MFVRTSAGMCSSPLSLVLDRVITLLSTKSVNVLQNKSVYQNPLTASLSRGSKECLYNERIALGNNKFYLRIFWKSERCTSTISSDDDYQHTSDCSTPTKIHHWGAQKQQPPKETDLETKVDKWEIAPSATQDQIHHHLNLLYDQQLKLTSTFHWQRVLFVERWMTEDKACWRPAKATSNSCWKELQQS